MIIYIADRTVDTLQWGKMVEKASQLLNNNLTTSWNRLEELFPLSAGAISQDLSNPGRYSSISVLFDAIDGARKNYINTVYHNLSSEQQDAWDNFVRSLQEMAILDATFVREVLMRNSK
jgi:hypothetical protein